MAVKQNKTPERLLIVDGYNVINVRRQIDGSQALADARDALIRQLQDYAGYSGQRIYVVFDAWLSDRTERSVDESGPVTVVFTRKGETADHYIERLCESYATDIEYRRVEIRVATSDALEQTIILGRGATRISSRELLTEMQMVRTDGVVTRVKPKSMNRSAIGDRLSPELIQKMREMAKDQ